MTRRALFSTLVLGAVALANQGERKRVSPHEKISVDLGGKTVTVTYGRPSLKGRSLDQLAPAGQVWRLGADEATKITLPAAATLGEKLTLAPGAYSLFAVPGPDHWTLILNKVADQWGAFRYDQSKDAGRIDVPVQKTNAPVEEFTISLDKSSNDAAKLTYSWSNVSVSTKLTLH